MDKDLALEGSAPAAAGTAPMITPAAHGHAGGRRRGQRSLSLLRLLSLRSDQASHEAIDATIRDSARVGGTNLWVLMFAIVIASVGLNVNSTAVIIGAMLISPLMGPIIGIGYGASIHDYELIRRSLRNLAVFVGISLFASTSYFFLTPLKQAHGELLARTAPTLWDVLIAFFGGAAGMIGLTRREKSTLIPGVAIATALMPPICTAGFGLATGQPRYFFGAFYLFLINAVFIALATLFVARILRLPEHAFPDEATRRRGRLLIGGAIALTLVPSIYLAYGLVREEIFTTRAQRFVSDFFDVREDLTVIRRDIDPKARQIALTLIGKGVTPELQESLNARLREAGIADAGLKIRHPSEDRLDAEALREQFLAGASRQTAEASARNSLRIAVLESRLSQIDAMQVQLSRVEVEILAHLPSVRKVRATTSTLQAAADEPRIAVMVVVDSPKKLPRAEMERLKRWLKTRLPEAAEISVAVGRLDV